MLETLSQFAGWYFTVGAILGFGFGTAAQIWPPQEPWTISDCFTVTAFWPIIAVRVIKEYLT